MEYWLSSSFYERATISSCGSFANALDGGPLRLFAGSAR